MCAVSPRKPDSKPVIISVCFSPSLVVNSVLPSGGLFSFKTASISSLMICLSCCFVSFIYYTPTNIISPINPKKLINYPRQLDSIRGSQTALLMAFSCLFSFLSPYIHNSLPNYQF